MEESDKLISTADICAPEEFSFCQFTTTKNPEKCPDPLFDSKGERKTFFRRKTNKLDFLLKTVFVIFTEHDNNDNDNEEQTKNTKTNGFLKAIKKIFKKIFHT